MKKNIVVCILIVASLLIGFTAGFRAYDTAEKYVELHGDMKTIITTFMGHDYTYDVINTSYAYDVINYTLVKGVSK